MNRGVRLLVVFVGLVLLVPAAAAMHEDQATHTEVSTRETTCETAATCDAPYAEARAALEHPSVDAELPDPKCALDRTQGGGLISPCQAPNLTTDPAVLSTYASIEGLTPADGDDSADARTQSGQASSSPGSGLDVDAGGTVLIGALGLGASGAAAFAGLRRVIGVLLAPLASRLSRNELLENDTRREIYEHIQDEPGINLRGLADEIDVAWGTLLHHLKKLEDEHLVQSERYGKYRRFFQNGSTFTEEDQQRLAALSTPSTARVAEYILENPGSSQSEVGDAIGVTASTVLFHVKRLKEVDLVEQEREGRYVHYYPQLTDAETEHLTTS